MINFYREYITNRHLDLGVGTGYLLKRCLNGISSPDVTISDLSYDSIRFARKALSLYNPRAYISNVLEPFPLEAKFDSIGINYLFHCLPGDTKTRGNVFRHVKTVLSDNGTVFGTTILGDEAYNFITRLFLDFYNDTGAFNNQNDTLGEIELILADNFTEYTLERDGSVAFFTANNPKE